MHVPSADRMYGLAKQAWRAAVPPTEDRESLTPRTAPYALSYLVPFLMMAYLVRRRDTHLLRVCLLPVVIGMALRCTFGYASDDPLMSWYEWDRGLLALVTIAKSIDFACASDGRLKTGEETLAPIFGRPTIRPRAANSETDEVVRASGNQLAAVLPRPIFDALDVALAMRGIGFDFGQHAYIHPGPLYASRSAFVKATISRAVLNYLFIDVFDTIEKHTSGITPTGGTIFFPHLPPVRRYAASTALHAGHGLTIYASVSLSYDLAAVIGVLLLNQSPSSWPPVQGNLLSTHSLHQFWSRNWHQSLRYTFLVLGGFPGGWLAGRIGTLFGVFLASGLFHEVGLIAGGKPFDHRVVTFFLLQAVGIALEKAYGHLTGRRVGGFVGTVWAGVFVLGFGQMCTESWMNRGLGYAIMFTPTMSVTRQLVLPFLKGGQLI